MKRAWHLIPLLVFALALAARPVLAQTVYPLPAPLYILTTDYQVLRVDPETGAQTVISPQGQPVIDFDISPDGGWMVYRTTSNNAVVVSQIEQNSGYVLEFDVGMPSTSSAAQTIAWAPDASAIACIVPGGIRIAEIGAEEYGAPLFSLIQGDWIELYWLGPDTLIASDASAQTTRISGDLGSWEIAPAPDQPARPQPTVPSYLTDQGVMLENNLPVPGTAGALSFRWGPPLAPVLADLSVLPRDLYFLAPDANGVYQLWRQPENGDTRYAVTAEPAPVTDYAIAPSGQQVAYVAGNAIFTTGVDGWNRREITRPFSGEYPNIAVDWSPDGTRLAFSDEVGVWTIPADASQPPLQVAAHVSWQENATPGDVRRFMFPQWSPDSTRLLVTIGYYEGSGPGVVDLSTGQITELSMSGSQHTWADASHVIAWASGWGYQQPGLYLLDVLAPESGSTTLLDSHFAVRHVARGADGVWYALVASSTEMGPQGLRPWASDTLPGQFQPLPAAEAPVFMELPQLAAPGAGEPLWVAGLGALIYDSASTQSSGALRLANMSTGEIFRVPGLEQVWKVSWGPVTTP